MAIITNSVLRKKFLHIPNSCHLGSGNIFGITAFEAAYKYGELWLNQLVAYLWNNVEYCDLICLSANVSGILHIESTKESKEMSLLSIIRFEKK